MTDRMMCDKETLHFFLFIFVHPSITMAFEDLNPFLFMSRFIDVASNIFAIHPHEAKNQN